MEEWQERFRLAAENAVRSRPRDDDARKDSEIKRLKQKVGELVLDLGHREDGQPPASYGSDDVRRVKSEHMDVSELRVCGVLGVLRSAVRERGGVQRSRVAHVEEVLAARVERLIEAHATYGYRRLWALLRFGEGLPLNLRPSTQGMVRHAARAHPRPRVQGRRSRAERSNERWAMDVTHINCGRDGWPA